MTDREKLIELILTAPFNPCFDIVVPIGERFKPVFAERIADHLIANGGTVQQWIPVTEKLPEMQTIASCDPDDFWEYECSAFVLASTSDGVLMAECIRDDEGVHWTDEGGTCYQNVPHWMPLPQPPKGG